MNEKICQQYNRKLSNKKYYEKNKEQMKKNAINWKKRNPEKVKESQRKTNHSEKTKIRKNEWSKQYKKENKQKVNARNRTRRLIKLKPCCDICGSTDNLEKHHWDYDRPLLVNILCKECHTIQHIKHFAQSKYAGGN